MNETHGKSVSADNAKNKQRDITARILCIVGAVLLWFYVVSSQTIIDERRFASIPVEIMSSEIIENEYGMTVISGYDYTVDITVSGVRNDINRIHAEDISAYVDLSQISSSGEYSLDVRLSVPSGVSIKELSSDYINVYVDKRASKSVEIRVNPIYTIESDYSLGTPSAAIDNITVTGPADILDGIDFAQVTVDVGKLTKSVTATGDIVLVGKDGSQITNPYVKLQEKDVTVKIPVYTEKDVSLSVGFKYGYYSEKNSQVKIVPETVRIKGDPTELAKINSVEVTIIDEKKMTGITNSKVVPIELPDGIENIDRIENATVTVTHINTTTREINVGNIKVKNPNGLEFTQEQSSINIILRGSSGSLSLITSDNISLEADLSYYSKGAGRVSVPLSVTLPSGLATSVYETGEYTMEFNIE